MADTTKKISGAVEPYYEYAQQAVDEQAILDKYNAATAAQFAAQREQNRIAENQFYNQMYNTQKTAMDTIRKSNAAAVASGASRGVQAAQELSSLLGLQQESVASATELAQANRQTAQEETAAMLENVLAAYQQAQQERSTLVQQGIEAQSVAAEQESAQTAAKIETNAALQKALETGTENYFLEVAQQGIDYTEYTPEGEQAWLTLMRTFEDEMSNTSKKDQSSKLNNFTQSMMHTFGITVDDIYNVMKTKNPDISVSLDEFKEFTVNPVLLSQFVRLFGLETYKARAVK